MMVALLLYAYAVGVLSSRKIERRTHEDIAFRVIAGGTHPDHTRISEFRRIHLKELEKLFVQVLQLCAKAKLVKLGHIAIDGTKRPAPALCRLSLQEVARAIRLRLPAHGRSPAHRRSGHAALSRPRRERHPGRPTRHRK